MGARNAVKFPSKRGGMPRHVKTRPYSRQAVKLDTERRIMHVMSSGTARQGGGARAAGPWSIPVSFSRSNRTEPVKIQKGRGAAGFVISGKIGSAGRASLRVRARPRA